MSGAGRTEQLDDEPLAAVVDRLRRERDGLREAMRTRALIEQAKGVLMGRHRIGADAAFERLRRTSQQTNVRLAELAASVVAEVSPPPPAEGQIDGGSPPGTTPRSRAARDGRPATAPTSPAHARPAGPVRSGVAGPQAVGRTSAEESPQARHLLLAARLGAAADHDAVVAALAEVAAAWPRPASVVLALLEPDGALRVVGSRGLTTETASQWTRIPPQVEVPLTTTARTGEAVWLADREQIGRTYPLVSRLAHVAACVTLPMVHRSRLLGVLGFSWRVGLDLDGASRTYLLAAAEVTARTVARVANPDGAGPASDQPWIQLLLDGALTPAALLSPVRAGGMVTDFTVVRANPAAVSGALRRGIRLLDATLLTVLPEAGLRTLLPLCRAVLTDGRPRQLDDLRLPGNGPESTGHYVVRVVRLGDRLQVAWRTRSVAELIHDDLVAAGRAVRVAAFRWHLPTGELRGSANLPLLLDWPRGRPLTPATVGDAVDPAGWAAVRRSALAALRTGVPVRLVVRTRAGDRWLRVAGERLTDDAGRPVSLRGHVQDITHLRSVRIPPPTPGPRQRMADLAHPPGGTQPV